MSRHRRRQKTNRKAPAPLRRSDTPVVHPPEAPRPRLEPLDDIPDLPVTPQGAFELPTAPSGDLPPETREWVSRFLPTLGPGMSPGAGPDDGFEPVDEPATPSEPAPAPSPVSPSASAPTPAAAPARQAPVTGSVPVAEEPGRAPASASAPAPPRVSAPEPRGGRAGRDRRGRGGSPVTAIAITVAVLAVVALLIRERTRLAPASPGAITTSAPAAPAVPATSDAVPEASPGPAQTPAPAATQVESAPAVHAPAVSVTAARAHAPPVALAPAAAAEATPAVVAATPRFTLEVATFIFEDRAQAERDRLAAAGHEVSVRSEGQDSSRVYRVLLGRFASRAAANRAAEPLLSAGTVQQARVVRLPKPE